MYIVRNSVIPDINYVLKKIVTFFALVFLTIHSFPAAAANNDSPQLILIHLDAVSTYYFNQELEKGNLPNIQAFFGDEGIIENTITYFPSKTPTVISSLRFGRSVRNVGLPGWEWIIDRVEETTVKTTGTFLRMAYSTSRLSRTNILYGLPIFHWLAGPALINTSDYLKDYNVLQFYWYNIDTQGHFHGEERYLSEYKRFDEKFGKLIERLDDDVNVIIYSDHGMTFGEGIEESDELHNLLGEEILVYSYPTLYIKNPEKKDYFAKKIVEETGVDFTFFEENEKTVKGYHKKGELFFIKDWEKNKIRYEYLGEDVLGYGDLGYNGEYLNMDEWLKLTYDAEYPMAPMNLFYHLDNEVASDIVTLFEKDRFPQTVYSSMGNHGGFTYQDMSVPLLVRGEEVSQLKGKSYYWLPDLFNDIEGIDFEQSPPRERHFIGSRYDFKRDRMVTEISFSPKYRIHYGLAAYGSDHFNYDRVDFWGKADLFRSYLVRAWAGVGVEMENSNYTPFFIFNYDIHVRRFVVQNSFATNRQFYFHMAYEVNSWLAITSVNFNSLGVRFDF